MDLRDYLISVVTVSDRVAKGERVDRSGPAITAFLEKEGYRVRSSHVVSDDSSLLESFLIRLSDVEGMDLVITTGGTGLSPRDITPETTLRVSDKTVDGIPEAIRAYGIGKTPNAMLSRGVAAMRKRTLIINFPGSPKACTESLEAISAALPHALGIIRGEKLDD